MRWFPQLETGANVQFPARRRTTRRTVLTAQPDGRVVKLADPDAAAIEWTLVFAGLTAVEAAAIESLFADCEGRRGTFTFLDPLDNLLKWSEDLTAAVWIKDAGLALATPAEDPLGGTGAAVATGAGEILQTAAAPATLQYCVSVYARSEAESQLTLVARAGAEESAKAVVTGAAWRRFAHSVKLASPADMVSFGMRVSGAAVQLFGPQAEAQRGASAYKRTGSRSGVYPAARFAEDMLAITSEGPDCHSCRVRVRSAVED